MSKDEWQGEHNPVTDSWYPTIFFYDIVNNKTRWEIFGAEYFVEIDLKKKVTVVTNEVWVELDKN